MAKRNAWSTTASHKAKEIYLIHFAPCLFFSFFFHFFYISPRTCQVYPLWEKTKVKYIFVNIEIRIPLFNLHSVNNTLKKQLI
jgi:hypothetical protein